MAKSNVAKVKMGLSRMKLEPKLQRTLVITTEIAERDVLVQQLDDGLVQEGAYVQTASGGKRRSF